MLDQDINAILGKPTTPQGSAAPQGDSTPPANTIRTMKSDAALAIKDQKETLVSIAIAEKKKKEERKEEVKTSREKAESPEKKTEIQKPSAPGVPPAPRPIGRIVVVLGVILVLVGLGFGVKFALPLIQNISLPSISLPSLPIFGTPGTGEPTQPSPGQPTPSLTAAIIAPQYEKRFDISKDTPEHVFEAVASERGSGLTPGSIKNLYFTEETSTTEGTPSTAVISANRLVILVGKSAPEILTRSLEKPFMAGFIGEENSTATPFLILKVSGYDTGFAGMLAWEATIPRFFDTLFGTKFASTSLDPATFRDIVILGHDARSLKGTPITGITYTFANPTTIVIAGSQSALEKLVPMVSGK